MLNDKNILLRGVSYVLINLGNAFKNGPCKIFWRHPWKMWSDLVFLNRPYVFKFFNGCLPQILHGQFLNAMYDKIIRAKLI